VKKKKKHIYENIFTPNNIEIIKSYSFQVTVFSEIHMGIDTTFGVKADWYRNGTLLIEKIKFIKSKNAEIVCERINTFLYRKNGNNENWKEIEKANKEYSGFLTERTSLFKNL
jgi:hypothetical protein